MKNSTGIYIAAACVLGGVAAAVAAISTMLVNSKQPVIVAAETAPPKPTMVKPTGEELVAQFMKLESWKSALDVSSKQMVDGASFSPGHSMFSVWSNRKLLWFDVVVTTNETSYVLIAKDSEKERGKRICLSGQVIEIHADKSVKPTIYEGGIVAESGNIFRFSAVHDTGEIAAHSEARFCGIVTEYQSYANSGGGTTHAASMVGMFDLPSNRKWAPADLK